MKQPILKTATVLLLSIGFLTSCKEMDPVNPDSATSTQTIPAEKIVLGKQLENPYTLSNMNKAYSNIVSSSSARTTSDSSPVHVTHLYLRFLPKDWQEYDLLKSDTVLKLYQIPLDYEITTFGNTYQDASIPEGSPTWQYVSIKKDHTYNQTIQHEILAELYIPELDVALNTNTANQRIAGKSFVDALVNEAMVLTQNYSDTIAADLSFARTTFNPNGTVKVFDTRLNALVPLQGVKMRARRWFDVREATTDANGWYQTSGFKKAANYSLIFETDGFDVRTGTFGQATIDGPKQSSSWNVDLWDGTNRLYGHVFRGAWKYFYGNIGGLSRPKSVYDVGTLFKQKLKYSAMDKVGAAQGVNIGNWSFYGTNPNIYVYRYNEDGIEYASDEIFSTTCHETCHTTHWQLMNFEVLQFAQVNTFIRESWPVAVEWYITSMEYRNKGIANYGTENYQITASYPLDRAYQYWTKSTNPEYTPIFIDLVDSYNQISGYPSLPVPNDQVTGYNLAGIEFQLLKHVYGISSLSEYLKKNKPSGVTDAQIDLLITSY